MADEQSKQQSQPRESRSRTDEVQREKRDPTLKSSGVAPEYPEGTHPIRPLSEQDYAAQNKVYEDMPDDVKPDPTTVANIEILPEER